MHIYLYMYNMYETPIIFDHWSLIDEYFGALCIGLFYFDFWIASFECFDVWQLFQTFVPKESTGGGISTGKDIQKWGFIKFFNVHLRPSRSGELPPKNPIFASKMVEDLKHPC